MEEYIEEEEADDEIIDDNDSEEAIFVASRKGKTVLQYKGQRYRKAYQLKYGIRWVCSVNKSCKASLLLNSDDEIISEVQDHVHSPPKTLEHVDEYQNDPAVVLTSRKGKEILLFRQYTYRKQYKKAGRCRWVCSTLKNCRAFVFTEAGNCICSACEDHCHPPPKYYLNPDNVISALREPLVFDAE